MTDKQIIREASHAGSWYTSSKSQLNSQLQEWLDNVKTPVECIGPHSEGQPLPELPVPSARMIIGPYVISKIRFPREQSTKFFLDMPAIHILDRLRHGRTNLGMYRRRE